MSIVRPVRIAFQGKNRLRSELLGTDYVYDIMENMLTNVPKSKAEVIADLAEKGAPKLDWTSLVERGIEILRLLGALQKRGEPRLSPAGRDWFDLLQELNRDLGAPFRVIQSDLPGFFFEKCLHPHLDDLEEVVIISPWVSDLESASSRFRSICNKMREREVKLLVISRPPDQVWHSTSLRVLRDEGGASVYVNKGLHAKIYISKTADRISSRAIIGSANLTKTARFDNVEVGILLRGITDRYYRLIEDLIMSSRDLKSSEWRE